jgi:peptidoglycan/LPS O-acetylase OafA/YrhL
VAADRELPSLTPLRGVAALWVVLYHYAVSFLPALHVSSATELIGKGYLAVDLFFMMSGFVMTHVYSERLAEPSRGQYWGFLSARIARLYPLHLFILALFIATAVAADAAHYALNGERHVIPLTGAQSLTALVANLLMLQGLNPSELSWNYPAWSISVEFVAYLGFPLALPRIWRASPRLKLALAAVLVGALFLLAYLKHNNFNQWGGSCILLRCLPEFMLGTLLYAVYRSPQFPAFLRSDGAFLSLLAADVVLLHYGLSDLAAVLVFPALILAGVANNGAVSEVLNAPVLRWLGERSYALYLFHGLIQFMTMRLLVITGHPAIARISGMPGFALVAAMLVAALICADLCHDVIENAGRDYVRRLLA